MGLSRWPLKLSLPRLDRSTLSTACLTTRTTLPDASPGVGQWGTYREHASLCQGLFSRILAHYWWHVLPFSLRHPRFSPVIRASLPSSPRRRGSRAACSECAGVDPRLRGDDGKGGDDGGGRVPAKAKDLLSQGKGESYGPLLSQGSGRAQGGGDDGGARMRVVCRFPAQAGIF